MQVSYERLAEEAIVAVVSAFVSMVWFASRAIRDMEKSSWRKIIGACLFSGTTAFVASFMFQTMGMDAVWAGGLGASVGTMGEKGFTYLVRNYLPGNKDE